MYPSFELPTYFLSYRVRSHAAEDKQSEALCADVGSVCDATYAFSIHRGAFNFTAGDWTHSLGLIERTFQGMYTSHHE
jgi:hypothetical protein